MDDLTCQLLVIGAGPGGYVCAIRAGQLGVDTIVVEAADPGGACLNVGCIPSKALIHAAQVYARACAFGPDDSLGISAAAPTIDLRRTIAWKDDIVARLTGGVGTLLKKAKVRTLDGRARFRDGKTVVVESEAGSTVVRAGAVVIATGSEPAALPGIPFGGAVLSSTEALSLTDVPAHLAVVGGGYIGLEIGTAFAKLGSKVTVVEMESRLLPQYDEALTRPVGERLAALGVETLLGTRAVAWDESEGILTTEMAGGEARPVPADRILVAIGRRPNTVSCGIEELSLTMNGPFVAVGDRCETSMHGVYAIGDVTGEPMLAHRAMAQGEMVAEIVAGKTRRWDKVCIPAVCFTDPEIVSVGLLPAAADKEDGETFTASFPFAANGRALTLEDREGFVRVVARKSDHVVLGLQAVGAGVSELSAAFSLAIEMGSRLEDIGATIHAHPTLSEAFQESALRALGHPLHI